MGDTIYEFVGAKLCEPLFFCNKLKNKLFEIMLIYDTI